MFTTKEMALPKLSAERNHFAVNVFQVEFRDALQTRHAHLREHCAFYSLSTFTAMQTLQNTVVGFLEYLSTPLTRMHNTKFSPVFTSGGYLAVATKHISNIRSPIEEKHARIP